jgi:hypothetical protein
MILVVASLILGMFRLNSALEGVGLELLDAPADSSDRTSPRITHLLSLGHPLTWSDWLVLRAFADPSYHKVKLQAHERTFLYRGLELGAKLDPLDFDLYAMGAPILAVVRGDIEGTRDLMALGRRAYVGESWVCDRGCYRGVGIDEDALRRVSEKARGTFRSHRWRIPYFEAYLALLEDGDIPRAGELYREASSYPEVPHFAMRLGEKLRTPDGRYEVANRQAAFFALNFKEKPELKERFEATARDLEVSYILFDLSRKFRKYFERLPSREHSIERARAELPKFLYQMKVPDHDPYGAKFDVAIDEDAKGAFLDKVVLTTSSRLEKTMGINYLQELRSLEKKS